MAYGKTVHVESNGGSVMVVPSPRVAGVLERIHQRNPNEKGPWNTIPGPTNSRSFAKGRWLTRKHNDRSKRSNSPK